MTQPDRRHAACLVRASWPWLRCSLALGHLGDHAAVDEQGAPVSWRFDPTGQIHYSQPHPGLLIPDHRSS